METKNYEKAFKTKKNKKKQSFLHTNIANLPHPQQRTEQHFFFPEQVRQQHLTSLRSNAAVRLALASWALGSCEG